MFLYLFILDWCHLIHIPSNHKLDHFINDSKIEPGLVMRILQKFILWWMLFVTKNPAPIFLPRSLFFLTKPCLTKKLVKALTSTAPLLHINLYPWCAIISKHTIGSPVSCNFNHTSAIRLIFHLFTYNWHKTLFVTYHWGTHSTLPFFTRWHYSVSGIYQEHKGLILTACNGSLYLTMF